MIEFRSSSDSVTVDPPLTSEEEREEKLLRPYREAHHLLHLAGVPEAVRHVLGERNATIQDPILELYPGNIEQHVGPQMIIRWGFEERGLAKVSKGVKIEKRKHNIRLSYLVPSSRPENWPQLSSEERAAVENDKEHPIQMGGWVHMVDERINTYHKDHSQGLATWISNAMNKSRPYFDDRSEGSAPDRDCVEFTYSDETDLSGEPLLAFTIKTKV